MGFAPTLTRSCAHVRVWAQFDLCKLNSLCISVYLTRVAFPVNGVYVIVIVFGMCHPQIDIQIHYSHVVVIV